LPFPIQPKLVKVRKDEIRKSRAIPPELRRVRYAVKVLVRGLSLYVANHLMSAVPYPKVRISRICGLRQYRNLNGFTLGPSERLYEFFEEVIVTLLPSIPPLSELSYLLQIALYFAADALFIHPSLHKRLCAHPISA
jgi:hypothetical protein